MESGRKLNYIEFFGGIGACSKALERCGIDTNLVDYCEIDKYPVKSFNAMHGTNFEPQDISKWDKDFDFPIDLIMHGSPCQDFSVAGHGKGGDEGSGTRSSLMYETVRIVRKLKPRVVIWENVKNLLSGKHKHNYDAYCATLAEMGYKNYSQVLNAKHYGIPQNRERVFTVSILGDHDTFQFPQKQELLIRLKDILECEVDDKFYISEKMLEKITWDKRGSEILEAANLNKGGERGAVLDPDGIMSCLSATDYKQPKQIIDTCIHAGDLTGKYEKMHEQSRRVYDEDGIAPTVHCCGGGNQETKVFVREATKKGYAEAEEGDSINLEQPNSNTRRGRVGHGVAQTLTTGCQQAVVEPFIAASRGRNPDNPSDRTVGAPTVQRLEPNSQGLCNTLTSVQKDNLVVEPINAYDDGTSRTLKAQYYKTSKANFSYSSTFGATGAKCGARIRKLTPKECWRLMGFDDSDFEKAESVNSNTQLYKQAGNSIVVQCLEGIIKQLQECGVIN